MLATGVLHADRRDVFFAAALHKVLDGGWFPLALGAVVFIVMVTWRRGRETLLAQLRGIVAAAARASCSRCSAMPPQRVPGTAVFLTSTPDATPHALLHSLKHYKVLHERNVFLTVEFRDVPWVAPDERVVCERLAHDCWRVTARYGFMDRPDVVLALELCAPAGLQVEPMEVSYFLSREKIVRRAGREAWRAGATGCSPRWRATPAASPISSTFRPTGWSSWARGSR